MSKNTEKTGTYSHLAEGSTYHEPMRVNNFEISIDKFDTHNENLKLSVANFDAPTVTVPPITISYGNTKIKYAGVPEVSDMPITVIDWIDKNTESALDAWFKLVVDFDQETIGLAKDYKKTASIFLYDTKGTVKNQWDITGCWPTNISYGSFTQDGNDVRRMTMTLAYDKCERVAISNSSASE